MQSATARSKIRRKRPRSDDSNTKSTATSEPASQSSPVKSGDTQTAPWRALFFFTTKANIPLLVAGIIFSIIGGAVSPAESYVMGKVFEGFTSHAVGKLNTEDFFQHEKNYVFYLLIISCASWLFLSLDFAAWLAFGELQAKSARDRLFHGLLEKDIEWYDMRKNGIGALLPRLQTRIRELQLATAQPLGALVTIVATAVLSLVQALVRSWSLTLVTISTVPLVMVAVARIGNTVQRNLGKNNEKLTEAQKFSTSAFSAIETVKCFNGQLVEQRKYMTSITDAAGWYYRVANANAMQTALIVLLSVSMFVQGFYYGSVLIAKGKLSTGDVITTFVSALNAFQALNGVLPQLLVLEKGRNAGATLRAIMAQVQEGSGAREIERGHLRPATCQGNIDVTSLIFAYPSRPLQPALSDVSLSIAGGDITFLIGKSGSGKSTLGQLLMRFYTSSQGSISLDGVNLESFDLYWLRNNIMLVEQTSSLFTDTVLNNISFGHKNPQSVNRRQVMEAAEFALLQLMINDMPNGLDTVVGYQDGSMSGGQRQRMALARARLRDTPILILDESTSALDRISRTLMMDALRQWRRGKTTMIITHDISQILPDEYVYVLEQGRLVQEGYRKDMERMKDMPFQDFFPKDRKASISPYDARKGTKFETRGSSLESTNQPIEMIDDPVEAQLNASEKKRATFVPGAFQQGGPIPAMQARTRTGLSAAFGSPWTRIATSPPLPPSPPHSASPRWSGWWANRNNNAMHTNDTSSNQFSSTMEDLISRTGKVAAEARVTSGFNQRKQAEPAESEASYGRPRKRYVHSKSTDVEQAEELDAVVPQSLEKIMSTVWPSVDWQKRIILILGLWGCTIHAICSPVFSFILSKLLQIYAIPGGDNHKSLVYSMIILAISVIDAVHTYIFRFFLEYVGQCWVDAVRNQAMERILDQPREFFDKEENSISRLTGCLDRNAEEMRNLLGRFLALIWIAALLVVVSVVWALVAQWKLTLITLAAGPFIFGVSKAFAAVSDKWESLSNDAAEDAAAIFTETFTNIKTVRVLTLEKHFLEKYLKTTNYALDVGFRRSLLAGFFYGLSTSAGNFSIAMVFYVGAVLVKDGTPMEHVIQVFTFLIFAISNVTAILDFIPQIGSSKDSATRLLRLSQLPNESHEHFGDTRIVNVGDIVFHDLHFSYPSRPEQTVLNHLSLRMKPGTATAIVGGSGSGKSTIANLLLNLYSTTTNAFVDGQRRCRDLTLSGRDINYIHTPSLRTLIVPVSQTPTLFAATVAENIAYGLGRSSSAKIESAAERAGIHDFIASLPQGYNTLVGDGGMGLSGGQAQRIAIARALIRNPAVLILDEATSALDVDSADLVRRAIECLVKDRSLAMTVIIITHSREMMEIAEHIVVLDQGRIVEEGKFEALLAGHGALANLLSGGEWTGDGNEGQQGSAWPRDAIFAKDDEWENNRTYH